MEPDGTSHVSRNESGFPPAARPPDMRREGGHHAAFMRHACNIHATSMQHPCNGACGHPIYTRGLEPGPRSAFHSAEVLERV